MSDWGASASSGWGDTANSGGWGDSGGGGGGGGGSSGWGDSSSNDRPRGEGGRGRGRGRGGRGRGGGESNSGGWGDSAGGSSSGGWGDNNSSSGGWGDNKSSSGGWGDNKSSSGWGDGGGSGGGGGGGSGGWGNSSSSSERPRGGGGRGRRGRGDEGGSGGSGGGWGDNKSSSGGWGDNKPSSGGWGDNKPSSGGWGDDKSSSDNKSSSGGWGDKKESSGGGWGDSSGGGGGGDSGWRDKANSNENGGGRRNWGDGQGDDQNRKRFKTEGEEDGEERPAPYKPEDLNLDEEAQLQGDGAGINFKKYDEQKVICLPAGSITPISNFEDVIKSELILTNIKAQKYTGMTPIQKWAIPAILAKQDLIGCAQTGSGKTAAFLLPVIQDLLSSELEPSDPNSDCQNPYCVIISPTRELARQISVHAEMLCRDSIIKCCVIYGQIATAHLKSKLSRGCHILVATPGRLKDFVERNWIGFQNVRYVILDEGDRLVDDGFGGEIKRFFEHPSMPSKDKRQTLFFSATFKNDFQMNAKEFLKDRFIFLTVGRIGAANEDIKQEFLKVSRQEKKRELKKILQEVPETEKTIVFTQTKMAADMLAGFFTALNLSSTSIHGDRHQSQREQAIRAFKKGEKRFLISSPVGNRGLDLPKVSLVINYDLPNNIDEYVHRIGRTGRAGHTGRAISFFDEERDREILPELIDILKGVKQEIPDWMEDGGAVAVCADAGGSAFDSWDAPAPATTTATTSADDWGSAPPASSADAKPSDDWGASSDDKSAPAQASSDNWATPTKETSEPPVTSTAESW